MQHRSSARPRRPRRVRPGRAPARPSGKALGRLWVRETAAVNDRAIALLDPSPGDSVLEIGCGPGRAVAELARRGVRVTGVDPSPVMIAQARRRNHVALSSGQARLMIGESGSLPVPGESFDAVLAIHTIHFWPDLAAGLREIRGLLAPGGRIGIGIRPVERGRPRRLDPMVYRIPTSGQLVDVLHAAGFVDTSVHNASPPVIALAHTPDRVESASMEEPAAGSVT